MAQRLVAVGESVVDVPAKLSTRVRVYSTGHGTKTDRIDAVATARAALHPRHLRWVQPDDTNVALKLLADRREDLVWSRTQAISRLHRLIRELIPGGTGRDLTAEQAYDLVSGLELDDPAGQMRVELALDYIEDVRRLDLKIDKATARIVTLVKESKTTLTRLYGIGPINAAVLLATSGGSQLEIISPATPPRLRSRCPPVTTVGTACPELGTGGSTERSMWPPSFRSVMTTQDGSTTDAR